CSRPKSARRDHPLMISASWTPILDPQTTLGARAARRLNSVTDQLMNSSQMDAALFLSYRGVAEEHHQWIKAAVDCLNRAIAGAEALYSTQRFELFGGLSGLGWVIEEVARQL